MSNEELSLPEETTLPKEKRSYTSQRVKFAGQVLAMLGDHLSDFQEERKECSDEYIVDSTILDAKIALVSDLSGKVQSLLEEKKVVATGEPKRRGRPPGSKNGTTKAQKSEQTGSHYIGVKNGSYTAFDSNALPTVASHGKASEYGFEAVYGGFRTRAGLEYRLTHLETLAEYKPLF